MRDPIGSPMIRGMTAVGLPTPHRARRLVPRALALAAISAVLVFTREPLLTVAVLFVLVVPFERWFPRHRQGVRRPHLGTDVGYALLAPLLDIVMIWVGLAITVVSLAWIPGLLLRPFVSALPPAVATVAGVVLFDVAIYWAHRFGHEIPFLWRFHRIHHSTEHLDWISGFRNHPLDGAVLIPGFALLLVAGFSPEFSGALLVIQIVTGLFLHANVRWRWRPLHRIVITPEFHHWHHANEPGARNSNYSVFLPLWDQLFGTYFMPADRRPSVYGVDGGVPHGIVRQLAEPLRGLRNPLPGLRHPVRGIRALGRMTRRGLRQAGECVRGERRVTDAALGTEPEPVSVH
jgi:sterol desaturase/sphingolipid hydroxylase (fatty acid hydroxylase superfamily)